MALGVPGDSALRNRKGIAGLRKVIACPGASPAEPRPARPAAHTTESECEE